jgi:DNA polymerase-3 subunit delta
VFDLIKAIAEKKKGDALDRLQRLLDAGEAPLMLLGFLARQMRQFWIARELARRGQGEAALARAAGVSPYAAAQIWRQAHGLSETDLRFALGRIAETDAGLKGAAAPPRLLMELLVIDLCAGQGAGLRRFLGPEGLLYLERQA